MNLYWVETADRAEDWFVVARSEKAAARWHEKWGNLPAGDLLIEDGS